jgi:hypothetical protein
MILLNKDLILPWAIPEFVQIISSDSKFMSETLQFLNSLKI